MKSALPNIPKQIARSLASSVEGAHDCRELYERLVEDYRPQGTLPHFLLYDVAKITQTLKELQTIRDATFRAAMRGAVEQCLKDLPSDDLEAHAKYALTDAKKDAAAWQRSKAKRQKINARLHRAGYDILWIKARVRRRPRYIE